MSSSTIEGIAGRAVVSAGVSSALQGTSFTQRLVNGVVADTAAIGANAIGGTYGATGTDPNLTLQTLAHGALGCAQGALTGGNCASGAAGAAAESVLGDVVTAAGGLPSDGNGHNTTVGAAAYATGAAIVGALAGQAAGGDAQSGTNTAVNSAANNYLTHNQIVQKQQDLAQAVTPDQKGQINSQYASLDARQQQNAVNCQSNDTGCTYANTVPGLMQTRAGLGTATPGCAIPTNCAVDMQQSQQEIQSALNGSGTTAPIYPVETAAAAFVVGPAALLGSGLDLSTLTVGSTLTASGIGAAAGAGFDVLGQAIGGQPYRPAQTVISAVTGAVAGPFATDAVLWNAVLGGAVNAASTAASNALYGNSNSLYWAFGVGALAGGVGTKAGNFTEDGLSNVLPKYIGASALDPKIPIILQNFGRANPYPSAIGQAVNQTVSGTTPIIVNRSSGNSGSQP